MKIEDYNKYYIQNSNHYLIPKDVFMELFNEMINWKEENKILRENAENNDKVVDNVNWENMLLKKKYENAVADYESVMFEKEQLKERIKYLERSNDRREDTILEQRQEISDLEDNWETIKQYCLDEQIPEEYDEYNSYIEFSNSVYDNILNKMQELERSDNQ